MRDARDDLLYERSAPREVFADPFRARMQHLAGPGAGREDRVISALVVYPETSPTKHQLTPYKQGFLRRCRSPAQFLRAARGDGRSGAWVMGLRNGGWCLGCSWALMASLFALGVMSLSWMALIAGLVGLEKVGPWGRAARVVTAGVLIALAIAILTAPHDVPGLVVPGSSAAMHAMRAMQ